MCEHTGKKKRPDPECAFLSPTPAVRTETPLRSVWRWNSAELPHKTESWEETMEQKTFRISNTCCRDQATGTAVNHSKPHQNTVRTLCTSQKPNSVQNTGQHLPLAVKKTSLGVSSEPCPQIPLGRAAWPSSMSTENPDFRPDLQANDDSFYFKSKPGSSSSCFWSSSPQHEQDFAQKPPGTKI